MKFGDIIDLIIDVVFALFLFVICIGAGIFLVLYWLGVPPFANCLIVLAAGLATLWVDQRIKLLRAEISNLRDQLRPKKSEDDLI